MEPGRNGVGTVAGVEQYHEELQAELRLKQVWTLIED